MKWRRAILGSGMVVLVFLAGVLAHAVEPVVLYDDFTAAQIDAGKWVREGEGADTERIVQIRDNRLRLFHRSSGKTDDGQSRDEGSLFLTFADSAAVTAIQAMVQVNNVRATGCPSNPRPTRAVTFLGGSFFNAAAPRPGSELHDVWALIGLARNSNMDTLTDVLQAISLVGRCTNANCKASTWLHSRMLGSVKRGEMARLRVQWDRDSHRFIFQRDDDLEVFALQAETGKVLWRYTYFHVEFSPQMPGRVWGHAQHRGVAVARGKVFLATQDVHLAALDAKSGEVLWKTRAGDHEEGHMFTSPPLIVKDKAILGIVTGEKPTRGFIDAYNIETGKREWRFYTVPGPGEPGHETWGGDSWRYGCGPVWLPGTYDAELNLVYLGIGNPCPMFSGDERSGDNLYTNAIVALDPESGQLKWSFQVIPHDLWDYDAANELVLVDLELDGKPVKALLQANKNGYLYAVDRTNGRLLYAKPFVARINWTTGLDATGRPSLGAFPTPEGAVICPSAFGAKSWNHMAYHPARGQVYIPAIDMCQRMKRVQVNPRTGVIYAGGEGPVIGAGAEGSIEAIDAQTGERRWQYRSGYPMMASVLATGGGLVLTGDVEGNALALDASNGALLWSFGTGSGLRGSPISYAAGGKQYIAVPSGWGGVAARNFSSAFPALATAPRGSTLFVFGLPEE